MKSVPIPIRCFAPDEFRHSTPDRVLFSSLLELKGSYTKDATYPPAGSQLATRLSAKKEGRNVGIEF
jgi:hypothetical protein